MVDYGHDLQFGFFLDPSTGHPERTVEIARILDDLGYDLIGVQDHPYQQKHFDAMALMAYILGQTERVRVFPDVANLPLRSPLMLAKEAATLDQLSGGRFELGLGAGNFWDAIRAMGGPVREPREALAALREAILLIRAFWEGRSLRHDGAFYQALGARPGPTPAHDMGIWLGVTGPRALRLTGELGDGWVPSMAYVPPSQAAKSNAIIDEAARAAGRNPAAIRRIYNIGGDVAPVMEAGLSADDQQIVGPREHWVTVLTHLAVDLGFSTFVLWGVPTAPRLRMFIEEIAPAVKARVAEARGQQGIT
ncbi:MAG: Coenzyme F420-dependent N(5),N(10)-methylenetetrahydromethanopterin reductase, partial [Thermomicrobiales bacterium]|nr:Coenzyme F420-dependent N(5),N(10)-methylenetetrahydromethanopterin reductase [Thermomicrobiales bacterium]